MSKDTGSSEAGLRIAIDYLPLAVFFVVNFFLPGTAAMRMVAIFTHPLPALDQMTALVIARVLVATAAFVIATVVAMIVSQVRLGSISPMLWISGVLVVVFGGLTMWFHDPRFIQMKPTFVYAILAAVLGFGLITQRPLLQGLLGNAYPGLTSAGWQRLTTNWAMFFLAMALANELARAELSYSVWVIYKFPGCAIITFMFAIANIPILLRHGLTLGEERAAAEQLPPE